MTNTQRNILIGAVMVLLLCLGIYAWNTRSTGSSDASLENATSTSNVSTSTSGIKVVGSGDVTVTEEPNTPKFDFSKPIAFSASIASDVRAALNVNLKNAQDALAKNVADFNAWIQLGNAHLVGGDAKAAEEIWLHAAALFPKNIVTYDNLGGLYLDYLKDYPKAETMFKKAIALGSHDVAAYRNLFSLYTDYGYKAGTSAAEDILKQGIANNPDAYELSVLLARYYHAHGRDAEAKASYDVAIATLQKQGNTQAAAEITAEKNAY